MDDYGFMALLFHASETDLVDEMETEGKIFFRYFVKGFCVILGDWN